MSLLSQVMIAERYGLRLDMDQLAEVLRVEKKTLYNQISAGSCPIKTYTEGRNRWADHRDVAEHFDAMRALAV